MPAPDPRATLDAAVSTAQQTADRARAAIERATAPAPGSGAAAIGTAAAGAPTGSGLDAINRDTTVDEAASALADELMPKLLDHYNDDSNVSVIVERREFDRRARRPASVGDGQQRRVIRDRRRARVAGDQLPLATAVA